MTIGVGLRIGNRSSFRNGFDEMKEWILNIKQFVAGMITVVLAVILALLPDYLAQVCHSGAAMKCHVMGEANKGVSYALITLGALIVFIKNEDFAKGLSVGCVVLSALAIANSKFFIGGCASPVMHCNTHYIPVALLVCGLLILPNLFFLIGGLKK